MILSSRYDDNDGGDDDDDDDVGGLNAEEARQTLWNSSSKIESKLVASHPTAYG